MAQLFYTAQENCPIQWNWVTLMGPDALDFLHRVTTVNTKSLPQGQGTSGCFLSAQGKIRAYFTLWNLENESYAFELDAGSTGKWKNDLLSVIDQYTFAEKMTLTDVQGKLECYWIFLDEGDLETLGLGQLTAGVTLALDEEIRVCHHGSVDYGRPWLTAWGRPGRIQQWIEQKLPKAQPVPFEDLETWRILALRPRVDQEITEASVPLEIGLKEVIADQKGCYPGQEVIEKIVSLGSPSRRLGQIQGTGLPPHPGEKIFNLAEPPAEIGQVTSSTKQDGKFFALGFIKKIHAKEGLEVQFSLKSRGALVKIAPYT